MATIHKLTKDGATIFPATITDAVVHPQTGKTLTSMMKDYNVSELFPTEGIDGGNKYNLALAIQVLGTHLSDAQKTGGIKLTFISSVSPYPEEEYYLGKSSWSGSAADWDQRFEVGDVIADPSGSWTPSTAEAYIDQQVATVTTDLTNEAIARQIGDRNLQTQLQSEMATRADQDANLNALINAGIREGSGVQFDIVPTQNSANGITSGGMYSTLKDSNLGFVDDEPTSGSNNLVKSGGVWQTPKFLFTENCPWIKEMYINQEGVAVGLGNIHNVYSDYLIFSNTGEDTFVGKTDASENNGINKIYYYDGTSIDTTKILGYTIVDWAAIPSNQEEVNRINDISKNIQYSPSIEANFMQANLQLLQDNTIGGDPAFKDYSLLGLVYSSDDNIYIQYPKDYKVKKVNQIKYKILTGGAVNFYKVTITGSTASFQLIATETNTQGDGTIKTLPINELILADNEYIGASGFFYFGVDDNAQGFRGTYVNVSSGAVGSHNTIALGYEVEYSEALSTKIEKIQEEEKGIDISSYGTTEGNLIANYDNVVILASDGTGDFTTFANAHALCSNDSNKYRTTLVIKPGIYDIPAFYSEGYVINYNIKGVGNPILKSYNETGDVDIKTTFSPFMMPNIQDIHRTIVIEGITLIGKNVRYCVHDELGALRQSAYTHVFRDCRFVHLTAPDSEWAIPRCIGGGLGNNGLVIIDNCEFQSEISSSVDYHTGFDGGAEASKVIVKDCILANNTVSCTSTTYQSDTSVMIVEGCILHSEPIYTDANNNQDFKLISKNNIIV